MIYKHVGYFPHEHYAVAAAKRIVKEVDCKTATVSRTDTEPGLPYLMEIEREIPADDLIASHEHISAIVDRLGGVYDGGETTVPE